MADTPSKRGFAAMDEEAQRAIASKGGKASPGNFRNDPEKARRAGRKGGLKSRLPPSAPNETGPA